MDFKTRLSNLNAAQQQAVTHIDGPVMVIAGPGTGKTELLSMRAANILLSTDILPENILCLTFTESGASAMRERLVQIIGVDAYKVAIHTFHSFGSEVINQNGEFFYHGAHFRPADELSCYELLHRILDELDYSSPLTSKMNGEYTHLRDILTTISELKKSGLTSDELLNVLDANDHVISKIEPKLADIFNDRITKTTAQKLAPLIKEIAKSGGETTIPGITALSLVMADSLQATITEAEESNSTKPITAWRNAWCKKDEKGKFILKAKERSGKLRAVSYVYYQYLLKMQEAELYDFDDMILRVVHAMEVFPELRFNLQEKYHYIMVDEFQDTNLAQMRILYNLTNNEVSAGKPNILVVGDDDQAIYSFQGADVGNIHGFLTLLPATKLITLTDNYRSTATILSHARSVITQGSNRLEERIADINKTLTAHHTSKKSEVAVIKHATAEDERQWVADSVAALVQSGTPASSIVVLARRHAEITKLLPYFASVSVAINYERHDNVLELEVIKCIEHMAKLLVALFEKRHTDAEALLPQLLAHPAFAISPIAIWQLSLRAHQNRQTWMELLAVTPDFMPLHEWLVTQAQALGHMPLERMLDEIMGTPKKNTKTDTQTNLAFVSPFFTYFFSADNLQTEPDTYLTYLEALRTIRTKLREYQPNDTPTLQTFLAFIEMHRQLGSTITSIRPQSERFDNGVQLMTAHKAKGLEFEHVYIITTLDTVWGEHARHYNRLINYPENLPLAPSGENVNERLRLFFVAMTRARSHLTLSYSAHDDSGKAVLPASFITGPEWHLAEHRPQKAAENLIQTAETAWYEPLLTPTQPDMYRLLEPALARYKLSSTHLTTFLDVSRGGPQWFLMHNLLRFPQAMSPSAGYGLAIHATLQRAHAHLNATGKHRPHEDILHDYEEHLKAQRLPEQDFITYLQKGSDVLTVYLNERHKSFTQGQKTELNFAHQSVMLGKAHLTGSLDLVDITDNAITVTDYKTGRALYSWTGKTDYEKIKLHKYKQQLMFYYLLIRNSRDYHTYTINKAVLEFVESTPYGDLITLEAQFSGDDLNQFSQLVEAVWEHITTLNLPSTEHYEPTYKGILAFEHDLLEGNL